MSIIYITVHNVLSKQRIDDVDYARATGNASKGTYFALRLAAISCTSWLLTSGWNLLIAARQPVCLRSDRFALQSWASGEPCVAQRIGTALSLFVL